MNMYNLTVPYFDKMLGNMEQWIEKGTAYATAKKFDPSVYLHDRFAPDQFPLMRQIQSACDGAKLACARATGKTAPTHADGEQSWDDLKARIKSVREYLKTFTAKDFEGSEERKITLSFVPGKYILGFDYVTGFALPNFDFHVTNTYQIFRHNGVELGKMDFLGNLPFHDA